MCTVAEERIAQRSCVIRIPNSELNRFHSESPPNPIGIAAIQEPVAFALRRHRLLSSLRRSTRALLGKSPIFVG
jgi:hypothetical protein